MHVWQETIEANLKQHNKSSTNILPHFWLIICCQCKEILQRAGRQLKVNTTVGNNIRINMIERGIVNTVMQNITDNVPVF